jgi:hypothetical protein
MLKIPQRYVEFLIFKIIFLLLYVYIYNIFQSGSKIDNINQILITPSPNQKLKKKSPKLSPKTSDVCDEM